AAPLRTAQRAGIWACRTTSLSGNGCWKWASAPPRPGLSSTTSPTTAGWSTTGMPRWRRKRALPSPTTGWRWRSDGAYFRPAGRPGKPVCPPVYPAVGRGGGRPPRQYRPAAGTADAGGRTAPPPYPRPRPQDKLGGGAGEGGDAVGEPQFPAP